MVWRGPIIGFLAGVLVTFAGGWVWATSKVLDRALSLTYAEAEADSLRHESDVLSAMVAPFWLGLSAETAQAELEKLGVFSFAKGQSGLAAGPVFLAISDGYVTEIQTHCARTNSTWCEKGEE